MSHRSHFPPLPSGWYYTEPEISHSLLAELRRELSPGHLLYDKEVTTFAWRAGATDDVLLRHSAEPERFTVVHLTWVGCTEINSNYPYIEFDGTFAEFLTQQENL